MTSRTGAAEHPDVDELSALSEDLLPASRAQEVRRHLDGCEDCSDTFASLEEIRALVGELPAPSPMPSDVAARINAAIATEALLAAGKPPEDEAAVTPQRSGETGAHERSPAPDASDRPSAKRHGERVSRETSSSETSRGARRRPAGHPRGATGPGRTGGSRGGSRRRTITLGAVFTAAVIGVGSLLLQTLDGGAGGSSEASRNRPSAHTFSSGNLESQVDSLLEMRPAQGHTSSGADTSTPSLDMNSNGDPSTPGDGEPKKATPLQHTEAAVEVPDCVQQGIGRSDNPIAAQRGTYEGTDAYLVVLPDTTDINRVSAYVVDTACLRKPPAPASSVLLVRSYPRP